MDTLPVELICTPEQVAEPAPPVADPTTAPLADVEKNAPYPDPVVLFPPTQLPVILRTPDVFDTP